MQIHLFARFRTCRKALNAIRYAQALALKATAPLTILIDAQDDPAAVGQELTSQGIVGAYTLEKTAHVDHGVQAIFVTAAENVTDGRKEAPAGMHLLFSVKEDGGRAWPHERPRICVPFGNRRGAAASAVFAIQLAAKLGGEVVACHTSYNTQGVTPSRVRSRHLTSASRAMLHRIQRYAASQGVPVQVELAIEDPTIHGFANRVANEYGCCLTVVAPGKSIANGAYERIVRSSLVPVIVAERESINEAVKEFLALEDTDPGLSGNDTAEEETPKPKRPWHRSPYAVELSSIGIYLSKGLALIVMGMILNSPMFISNGIHMMSDAMQDLVVIITMSQSDKEREGYPLKQRMLETIMRTALGIVVVVGGVWMLRDGVIGLLAQVTRLHTWIIVHTGFQMVQVVARYAIPMTLAFLIFAEISRRLSKWQISVGNESKYESLVDIGKETGGDKWIEVGTAVAAFFVHGLGWVAVEYIVTTLTALLVLHVGYEIFLPAWRQLMHKSLGIEIETQIRETVLATCGVEKITQLITYSAGALAICNITIETRLSKKRLATLQGHLKRTLRPMLAALDGIRDVHLDIVLVEPEEEPTRYALAYRLNDDGQRVVVSRVDEAEGLLVIDQIGTNRSEAEATPHELETTFVDLVRAKKVAQVLFHAADLPNEAEVGCPVGWAFTSCPKRFLGAPSNAHFRA